MNTVMVIEILVGVVVLVAAVRFAVRETRNLSAAMESEAESVETAPQPSSESQVEPKAEQAEQAEQEEQKAEQKAEPELSEVSSAETN
jgi:predicted Holliday junction resolvase-like endonuclease